MGKWQNHKITSLNVIHGTADRFNNTDGFMTSGQAGLPLADTTEPPQIRATHTSPHDADNRVSGLL